MCGPTITKAQYQEVDFFMVSDRQHRANTRSKRMLATSLVQKNLNDENRKRWFNQLAHTNFTENDYKMELTIKDKFLPSSEDEAWKMFERYVARINYRKKKLRLPPCRYMVVLECKGKKKSRYHFHVIIDGDLPSKVLRELWSQGRGAKKERIGSCGVQELDYEGYGGTIKRLCDYMLKDSIGKRRWRQSIGLKKPKLPPPNDGKYSRRRLEEICKNRIDDYEWWKQQYPGWELIEPAKAKYNDFTGWSLYARLRKTKAPRAKPKRVVHFEK